MTPAIFVKALRKEYQSGKPPAVQDLDFEINPGEAVAFLGPNGAGKSTTLKLLCGILTPTSGAAQILGETAGTLRANQNLGLVFGTRSQLYLHMTVFQSLDLVSEIYGLSGAEKRARIADLSRRFGLDDLLSKRVRTLSLGQRMKAELVAGLVHRPKVLLADEPTIGLDILAKNQLRELIREWRRSEETTLLLTSHDLSDVEALCERCILIDHGQKRFDGRLSELRGGLSDVRRIRVTLSAPERGLDPSGTGFAELESESQFQHRYEIHLKSFPIAEAIATISRHYQDRLQDLQIEEVSLEEVLAKQYRGQRG